MEFGWRTNAVTFVTAQFSEQIAVEKKGANVYTIHIYITYHRRIQTDRLMIVANGESFMSRFPLVWLGVFALALWCWCGRFNFTATNVGGEGTSGIVYRTNLWTGETYMLHGGRMKKVDERLDLDSSDPRNSLTR